MTELIEHLKNLPYIDVTVRLYNTAYPKEIKGGVKSYFACFCFEGSTVSNEKGQEVGSITSPMGGGTMLYYKGTGEDGQSKNRWYLPPDDIWNQVREIIGFNIPEDTGEPVYSKEEDEEERSDEEEIRLGTDRGMFLQQDLGIEDEEETTEEEDEDFTDDVMYKSPEVRKAVLGPKFPAYPEPDYLAYRHWMGGYLKDIPLPHRRFWPGAPRKKSVRIRIMRYYGQGPHYHTSLKEEHNPIWDTIEGTWRESWDDEEGRGRDEWGIADWPNGLRSYQLTKIKIEEILAREFPPEKYEYVWDDMTDERYEKEGD